MRWVAVHYGLDWLAAGLAITSATLIRQRRWSGYALSLPAQVLYAYLVIRSELYGVLILNVFYFVNGAVALVQWRRLDKESIP